MEDQTDRELAEDIEYVEITAASHPALFRTLDGIAELAGLEGYPGYSLDTKYGVALPSFEELLGGMSELRRLYLMKTAQAGGPLPVALRAEEFSLYEMLQEFCDGEVSV
jgi:hypothetical protein